MRDRSAISDLARMFGGKPRSFQLWSDRGVIEPLPETKMKGTGTAQAFDRRQTEIAGIVAAFHRQTRAPIGQLWQLADFFTHYLNIDNPSLTDARIGKGGAWLLVYLLDNDPDELAVDLWVDFMAQHQAGWDDLFYNSETSVAIEPNQDLLHPAQGIAEFMGETLCAAPNTCSKPAPCRASSSAGNGDARRSTLNR